MDIAHGSSHLLDGWSILVRRRWVIYLSVIALVDVGLSGIVLNAVPEHAG